ncbi:hypothetical protein AAT19DRAFT_11337 [Rhodotorula toruloides]|uniref:Uncharacterized protein n=1 Tax=Rhodotorula toruloides TaxID=5286 RepID=A0A2S9ZXU6_RHOTO|nr:hypothetical protein AAT19DRAFT_11337 [Rhodotorula toruloides]
MIANRCSRGEETATVSLDNLSLLPLALLRTARAAGTVLVAPAHTRIDLSSLTFLHAFPRRSSPTNRLANFIGQPARDSIPRPRQARSGRTGQRNAA